MHKDMRCAATSRNPGSRCPVFKLTQRLADTQLAQQAASEIEQLRFHAAQMREVCKQLVEQLYTTNSMSGCGEDAAIARATRH